MSLPVIIKDIENRFKISGGTLTGNVEINKSNYPMIMIKDLGQGRRGEFIYNINEEVIISNYKDENNRSLLFLRNENNVNNSLQLSRVVDGQWSNYNIYGEHNKPAAADIGAAPTTHNHTSLTGITSLGFSTDNTDSASISTSIDGTNTYFDFNLSDDPSQNDTWRWRFSPSGGTLFNAMTLDVTSITEAKLTVQGSIQAASFSGALSGNASTASKLATARTISLSGSVTGSGSFDGSGNLNITTSTNHNHSSLATQTADISFAGIASWPTVSGETYPLVSKGLYWSGSSDFVKMFYRVTGSDKGELVIQLGDGSDERVVIENGTGATQYTIINNGGVTAPNFNSTTNYKQNGTTGGIASMTSSSPNTKMLWAY